MSAKQEKRLEKRGKSSYSRKEAEVAPVCALKLWMLPSSAQRHSCSHRFFSPLTS